jgi:hypothetical protein
MRIARYRLPLLDPVDLKLGNGIGGRPVPDVDPVADERNAVDVFGIDGFGRVVGEGGDVRVGKCRQPACVRAVIVRGRVGVVVLDLMAVRRDRIEIALRTEKVTQCEECGDRDQQYRESPTVQH